MNKNLTTLSLLFLSMSLVGCSSGQETASDTSSSKPQSTQVTIKKSSAEKDKEKSDDQEDTNSKDSANDSTTTTKNQSAASNKIAGKTANKPGKTTTKKNTNASPNKSTSTSKVTITDDQAKDWAFRHVGTPANFGVDALTSDDFTFLLSRDEANLLVVEVRENHSSEHFKGKSDPNTAPLVAIFRINQKNQLEKLDPAQGTYSVIADSLAN